MTPRPLRRSSRRPAGPHSSTLGRSPGWSVSVPWLRWAVGAAGVLLAGGGCAPPSSPVPRSAPAPATEAQPVTPPRAERAAARFDWSAGASRYRVASRTLVRVAGDSVGAGTDSVQVRATVTLAVADGGLVHVVAGTISEAAIETGGRMRPPGPVPLVPVPRAVSFAGEVGPSVAHVPIPAAAAANCAGSEAGLVALAREVLPLVPATMAVGDRWRDSVVTVVCRSGVQLTTVARHEYEVAGLATDPGGAQIAELRRRTAYAASGTGTQTGRPVAVTGSGSGSAELRLDLARGRLLALAGQSVLTLEHRVGERRALVEQAGEVRAELLPDDGTPPPPPASDAAPPPARRPPPRD